MKIIQIATMTQKYLQLVTAVVILFALAACEPMQSVLVKTAAPQVQTLPEEQAGQYLIAADKYLQLAKNQSEQLAALYRMKAAELYWQEHQTEQSQQALLLVSPAALPAARQTDYEFLSAQVDLAQNNADSALKQLNQLDNSSLSDSQKRTLYKLRIAAYEKTENWLEKSLTHLKLEPLLSSPTDIADNRNELWQSLMQLSPQALDLFNPGVPPAQDSGWFALAYTIKAYQTQPEVLQVALEDWKRSYPNHPADPALYESVLAAGTHLPTEVNNIAVLLPASGPYVEAAKAIRQGIIAANYSTNTNAELHFLDIDVDQYTGQSNVLQQYQRAVADGANIVIGPLQKQSVDALAVSGDLKVPVLALNRIDDRLSRPNLYQYGLAPEDDAIAAANYAQQQGFQRSVVLAPNNEWGERIANAFNEQWRKNGGQILYQSRYDESESDFSNILIPLLGIDKSKQRYQNLKAILRQSIDFEPRRRHDIDFIFLVAKPLKARQLVPQLKFHRSADLPIIATSHAYAAHPDPQQDIDLNGLILTDMPWMFTETAAQDPAYQAIESQANNSGLLRLYAMGVDAYRLIPQLNTMSRDSNLHFQGATGDLNINSYGQVERTMPWATFKQGTIQLIQ